MQNITKSDGLWAYGLNKSSRVAHVMQRNNYTGPSPFHIWSDDIMLCAKSKTYGWAREPSYDWAGFSAICYWYSFQLEPV